MNNADIIHHRIFTIRDQKVILDRDLAAVYSVDTGALNRAVKRNAQRFPADFIFRLTKEEYESLRCQSGISKGKGGRRYLPYAFTEHGAIMAATVLNSPRAVEMSVFVVRAFVKMREQLLATTALARRLAEVEKGLLSHDAALRELYHKIRPLLLPPPEPDRKPIGFSVRERRADYPSKRKRKS
jgi:hypothetical protein